VYKLEEIDRRFRLLRHGGRVLDLGCAPGSWLQYAARRVGSGGLVVGLDRAAITVDLPAQVVTLQGDVFAIRPAQLRERADAFDALLSDLAPDTSGIKHADAARSADLVRRVIELGRELLAPGGHLLAKVFEGPETNDLLAELRQDFATAQRVKPRGSRKESKETYLLGRGFRGGSAPAAAPAP